jgi:hypothetical protein
MGAIGGTPAYTEKEQPAAPGPNVGQCRRQPLDRIRVETCHNFSGFFEVLVGIRQLTLSLVSLARISANPENEPIS